jgi:thiamine monophosphate synthase
VLEAACASAAIPILAVGGIDAETASRAVAAGASGVAAIRHFFSTEPAAAVRALRTRETAP